MIRTKRFRRRRSVAESHLRLKSLLQINVPLEPLRLFTSQLFQRQCASLRGTAFALDTAFAIHGCQFQHQRVAIAIVVDRIAVGMIPIDGRCLHTHRISPAMRHTFYRQRFKANVTTSIVSAVQIRVRHVRDEAKAIDLKQLRKMRVCLSLK